MGDILSRIEKILESKIYGIPYTEKPQSRIEELLIALDAGSGGGGSSDWKISVSKGTLLITKSTSLNERGDLE